MEATSITWLEAVLALSVQVSCITYFTSGALFPNTDSFSSFTYIINQWDGRGKVVSRELPEVVASVSVYICFACSCSRSHRPER